MTEDRGSTPIGPLPDAFEMGEPRSAIKWTTAPNNTGFWLVSDYGLARRILTDRRFRRSDVAARGAPNITSLGSAPDAIVSLDGAEHARIRRLVAPAFTERRIAELAPFISRSVAELLDAMEASQAPVEFVSQVSSPLPFGVLCHLLGIPPEDREIFGSWVNMLFRLEDNEADNRPQSIALVRYMMRLIDEKRRNPADDLISQLSSSADQGRATNREIVTLCLSLLMAGFDTTKDQITLCVLTLLLDEPLTRLARDRPELIPRLTDELMRVNPATYMTFPRMAVERARVGDKVIEPGQLITASIIAANRDPSLFSRAEQVELEESVRSHLTFGHGVHRCLGAPLALLQLTTLLTALIGRFPRLRLVDDPESLDWKTGMATRGPHKMHVTW